ncbi:MAG: 30S ribosomal protein S7, partial [Patescibacteria group bacterium]
MRRKTKIKKVNNLDHLYGNPLVGKFINYIMRQGKKATAQKVVYRSFDIIKEKTKSNPIEIFEKAIKNISPSLEVKSRRVGGANYQVPQPVRPDRKIQLVFRWIINAARAKKGKSMADKSPKQPPDSKPRDETPRPSPPAPPAPKPPLPVQRVEEGRREP